MVNLWTVGKKRASRENPEATRTFTARFTELEIVVPKEWE
jgi:hypothetical protein